MTGTAKRSVGVTIAAIILVAGSALMLLMALLVLVLPFAFGPAGKPELTRGSFAAIGLAAAGLFYLALAAWGIATAVGILRLRRWARVSILVMSALAVMLVALISVMTLILPPVLLPHDPRFMREVHVVSLVMAGLPSVIALWWIILFTRESVKRQFASAAMTSADTTRKERNRPLSITIIAVWLLVAAPMSLLWAGRLEWSDIPKIVLGVVISGWAGTAFYVALPAVSFVLGLALLRMRPWARVGTLSLCVFTIANNIGAALRPRVFDEMARSLIARSPSLPPLTVPHSFLWVTVVFGAGCAAVAMWFLITRRAAFTPSAAMNPAEG